MLGERGLWFKMCFCEGSSRVPLLIAGNGFPARRVDTPVSSLDILPTLCDLGGVPLGDAGPRIDGQSLLPLLTGEVAELPARDLFFVRREGGGEFWGLESRALRRWPYKLVQNRPFEPYQLFDLANDPQETTDLAGKMPGKVRELAAALSKQIQRGGKVPWLAPAQPLVEEPIFPRR